MTSGRVPVGPHSRRQFRRIALLAPQWTEAGKEIPLTLRVCEAGEHDQQGHAGES
jgi:hypothetical protein